MFGLKRLKEDRLLNEYLRDEKELGPPTQETLANRLIRAVKADQPRIVDYCLDRGVSPDTRHEFGHSPGEFMPSRAERLLGTKLGRKASMPALVLAIFKKSYAAADVLVKRGADLRQTGAFSNYDEATVSPLYLAARRQNAALVNQLLESGANPDIGVRGPGSLKRSPLQIAAQMKNPQIVEAIASHGAADIEAVLHYAEENKNRDYARILQEERRRRAAAAAEAAVAPANGNMPGSISQALNAAAQPSAALEEPIKAMKPIKLVGNEPQ
jgi:hypothetical protein